MPSVAVIGTRGYPSYYGGFETAIRKLAPYLADNGWDVTVYGRPGSTRLDDPDKDGRVTTRITKGLESKSLSTLSYGLSSSFDAARHRPDVALVMNVANGFYLPLLRSRGVPSLVNVDGLEWERAKWGPRARQVFRTGARFTAKWASGLVFDARAIESHWNEHFGVEGRFIPYGGDVPPMMRVPEGLTHRGYVLIVARFVPENSVPEFFQAVPAIAAKYPVVIVGSAGYGGELDATAADLAATNPSVSWLGHVSDDGLLLSLWQHAGVYFHGHSVGGTNPALVQAMAAGAPVLARDTVYNREVLGQNGVFVKADPDSIATSVLQMMSNARALDTASKANLGRAEKHYAWADICGSYEESLRMLAAC
ncbi:glycosyltransferase [Mycolicibacterium litorale]|uniref:Glycosyl transferase n=1 Tax=Mycolicibacterium litorale TaxID=758802 RepID=A0AAD1ITV7_9MYCO|nr:glycosyltransferase [Mycolicibacterium litorale]MCV7416428.1 glycosyltransferase [Mycolicibacterium litorale]TDY09682.1 glycosyltransferase involved in cell wall biosynthesis [Mycolicibacterium litorale]BBY17628.1 glycosyl transferase [Mycolicibacterium litorale]